MTIEDFQASVHTADKPASGLSPTLQALWYDARGDWDRAHELAQEVESPEGAWVHAYLHRKEGDPDNARYWYRRAGRRESAAPLPEEWEEIASTLLSASH
jgi:hypothetical protein